MPHQTKPHNALQTDHPTHRIARVHARISSQATRILAEAGDITLTQWRVLSLLRERGTSRAVDLVQASDMDKGMMSRTTKQLIAARLIKCKRDKIDQRVQRLTLTPSGHAILANVDPSMQNYHTTLHACMDHTEAEVFTRVLNRLEALAGE